MCIDLRDALAEEDCHFTIRALRQHLEQLPNQTHGQGRLIANKQQVPSIESPNFDLECTDGHGVYSNEAIPTISSEVSKCLKNGPLREILRHLTDKYNRTIKSKVETTQSDNTEQIVISITRPCAEIGTQTDFPDDTFITGRSVNAPSRQSETDPDYYQTSLSLSHLFPRSSRFGTVRLVQFHGARLGLSLVRSSSKHKPTPTVSLPTAAHTGHTTSTGSMRVASVDTIIESVIVQAKNKLLLTQEAMSGIQVGDELVSINGICPLAGLYTFAQQMDMIKTSTRPLVLGFATIY